MADGSTAGAPEGRPRNATDPTRVALIAPDSLYRDAIERYLREQVWLELVGVVTEDDGADRLLSRTDPELVILRDRTALDGLTDAARDTRFVLMESPETMAQADELLRQGVVGFISPDWSQAGLDLAFIAIRAGQVILPSSLTELGSANGAETESSLSRKPDLSSLTARQMEVLALLPDGLTNKQIGGKLKITESTVKSHVHRILGKLGVRRRGQAAALYLEWIRKR